MGPDGNVIDNTTLRDVSLISSSPSTTMTLLSNPLRTNNRGMYRCRANFKDVDANFIIMKKSSKSLTAQNELEILSLHVYPVTIKSCIDFLSYSSSTTSHY